MKIFVVSDTHGNINNFLSGIRNMEMPDLIIHLGDYVGDGEKIGKETGVETIIVKGNGDFFEKGYQEDLILKINGKVVFITHGHNYGVRRGIDTLYYKAAEVGADLVLFGHTHVPILLEEPGVMIMNPGSPYLPRKSDRKKTFAIVDIDEDIAGSIVTVR